MKTESETELTLNIIPISFESEKILVGRLANIAQEEYKQLRDTHWKTHSFRYDRRTDEILNISLQSDIAPLGKPDEVNIKDHLLLLARAIQRSILVWLSAALPILRGDKKLKFWGQAENALLLSQAVDKIGLTKIPDLEVVLCYEIDSRMFQEADDMPYLGLVIDLSTSNIIDIPVSELQKMGLKINGRYVCRRQEFEKEYLRPRLDLLGRVSSVQGNLLLLTDTEGITEVKSDETFLEPRTEYLHEVIRLYYDSQATGLISALENFRKPINSSIGKLARIRETVAGLKKRSIIIGNNVTVQLEEMLESKDTRFPPKIATDRPTLLFGPHGRNRSPYPDAGITNHGPYMYMQHERNTPLIAVICEARYRGVVEQFMQMLRDGYPSEMWRDLGKENPYKQGLIGKFRLSGARIEYEECRTLISQSYKEAGRKLLNRLPETPDLAIVQIQESFMQLYGDLNPYYVTKAVFMMAGVPTQSVRIENINFSSNSHAYLLNNIALQSYAKLDGIPWVMATYKPTTHEIVMGLSSAEVSTGRQSGKTRYVGITSVFQGDGRYLVWGVTREVEFEKYPEALLESLKTVISYVKQQNAWQSGDKVRLVCHVYKRLKDAEVEAIKELVRDLIANEFDVEFAFLDISWQHPYHIFAPSQEGVSYWDSQSKTKRFKGIGVPTRGLCLQLDRSRGLLHLTGPGDVKTETQGIPKPLLVELHSDSDFTDLTYLLRQVYHFAYMSWRGFFPGAEPVTITYSRLIAKLLGNLKTVNGWDSQVLSFGSLRDRRWFL